MSLGAIPTVNPLPGFNTGNSRGFITEFNATGSALLFSSYYTDAPLGLALDATGNVVYVAGGTYSTSGIATSGAFQGTNHGSQDAFIAAFSGFSPGGAPAPTNIVATAITATSVTITWSATAGTTCEVLRLAAGGASSTIGSSGSGSLTDTTASANTAYLYKVRTIAPGVSPYSTPDLATTIIFTTPSLVGTKILAAHITELRTAVNAVRTLAGLSGGAYPTDPTLGPGVFIKAAHVTELRSALDAGRSALLLPAVGYTRASIVPGVTIAASDINDLRTGVR